MKPITATLMAYYMVCRRKAWLSIQGITPEYESSLVQEGNQISENSYNQRATKFVEVNLEHVKIDFFDAENKVVHEVKKSDKLENSHIVQVQYYIYEMRKTGIDVSHGILEYPKLRKTMIVNLTSEDEEYLNSIVQNLVLLNSSLTCPPTINKPFCKQCSFYDFCYVDEVDD